MRFSVATVLAFAAAVIADVTGDFDSIHNPEAGSTIDAGKEVEVKWDAPKKYDGKVTIILVGGSSAQTQIPLGDPIATGIDNLDGKYKWKVSKDLGDEKIYGLQFKYEDNPEIYQYSPGFHIKKADGSSSTETGTETGTDVVTMTKAQGVKTVTLSTTSTTPTTTSTTSTTSTHHNTTMTHHNSTMTHFKPTMITTQSSAPASTTSEPAPTSTNGAANLAAGSVAAAGGLLMALMAL